MRESKCFASLSPASCGGVFKLKSASGRVFLGMLLGNTSILGGRSGATSIDIVFVLFAVTDTRKQRAAR